MKTRVEKRNRLISSFNRILLAAIFIVTVTFAGPNGDGDKTYLVKFTHTKESCLTALDKMANDDAKLLKKVDWGCMSGDHTGYMIVTGKDENSVMSMIPKSLQDEAKVEKLDKFTKEQIESFHK